MNYGHNDLGTLYLEDTDWNADEVSVPFAENTIGVSLADGSDNGPSQAALSGYQWIQSNWQVVLALIQGQCFEFYSPYADAFEAVPGFDSPADLLGSEILQYLRIFDANEFEITLRFTWQEPDDTHEITFFVDGGRCESHSVDG